MDEETQGDVWYNCGFFPPRHSAILSLNKKTLVSDFLVEHFLLSVTASMRTTHSSAKD